MRSLLHLVLVSLLVRRPPPRATRALKPALRRSPLWAIRRHEAPVESTPINTSDPPSPKLLGQIDHWEGVGDPTYLLGEIEELRAIAKQSGLGTLAYLLECAAIEARRQVGLKQEPNW